jgi:hypothetical protein
MDTISICPVSCWGIIVTCEKNNQPCQPRNAGHAQESLPQPVKPTLGPNKHTLLHFDLLNVTTVRQKCMFVMDCILFTDTCVKIRCKLHDYKTTNEKSYVYSNSKIWHIFYQMSTLFVISQAPKLSIFTRTAETRDLVHSFVVPV